MRKMNKTINIALIFILTGMFLCSNASYSQDISCLRVPLNGEAVKRVGLAISLERRVLTPSRDKEFTGALKKAIKKGKAWTLFRDRRAILKGDTLIKKYPHDSELLQALRSLEGTLPENFDVVIADIEDSDVAMYPGYKREQFYITARYLNTLGDMYAILDKEHKDQFVGILQEGFKHEIEHMRSKEAIRNKSPPEVERIVEQQAPSFRTRELFRVAYLKQKLADFPELHPDLAKFLDRVKDSKDKASYLYAYLNLPLEKHLEIVKQLLSKRKSSQIDIMLAQHHIGYVLDKALESGQNYTESAIFKEVVKLLKDKDIIDIGPESRKPYPVFRFIRELMLQDILALGRDIKTDGTLLQNLTQLKKWAKGTQKKIGDSTWYPMPGETTTLPITKKEASERIIGLSEDVLSAALKSEIVNRLRANKDRYVIIKRDDLKMIGDGLLGKTGNSISAAGAGTRYAVIIGFDNEGKPYFSDRAKGVLEFQVDGGRSFIEMFLGQSAHYNEKDRLKTKIPTIIYDSHSTDKDVTVDLERIGYHVSKKLTDYIKLYSHEDPKASDVYKVRLHKTHIIDKRNGDFLTHADPDAAWEDVHWAYAHDSAIVDLITSGIAYEMVKNDKYYMNISNVDNRAGGIDPIVLAIMELTKASLLCQVAEKQPFEKGGGAPVHFKEPFYKDHVLGNVERPSMDSNFEKTLTAQETADYLPYKNTANYCLNIIEYAKEAFLGPESTNADVLDFLRAFYEARENPEKKAELTFKKIDLVYKFKPAFIFYEDNKKFQDGITIGSLAGMHTWLVKPLYLAVPNGQEAGNNTMFEEQKENIYNWERWVLGTLSKILEDNPEVGAETKEQVIKERDFSAQKAGELRYAAAKVMDFDPEKTEKSISEMIAVAEKVIQSMRASIDRLKDKRDRDYLNITRPGDAAGLKGVLGDQTRKDLLRMPVGQKEAYNRIEEVQLFSIGSKIGRIAGNFIKNKKGDKPINILLIGPPGSLKTTLANTLKKILQEFDISVKLFETDNLPGREECSFARFKEKNPEADVIIAESVVIFPKDAAERTDLFIKLTGSLYERQERITQGSGSYEYAQIRTSVTSPDFIGKKEDVLLDTDFITIEYINSGNLRYFLEQGIVKSLKDTGSLELTNSIQRSL